MLTSSPRQTVFASLRICLVLGLLLLPFAISAAPTYALRGGRCSRQPIRQSE